MDYHHRWSTSFPHHNLHKCSLYWFAASIELKRWFIAFLLDIFLSISANEFRIIESKQQHLTKGTVVWNTALYHMEIYIYIYSLYITIRPRLADNNITSIPLEDLTRVAPCQTPSTEMYMDSYVLEPVWHIEIHATSRALAKLFPISIFVWLATQLPLWYYFGVNEYTNISSCLNDAVDLTGDMSCCSLFKCLHFHHLDVLWDIFVRNNMFEKIYIFRKQWLYVVIKAVINDTPANIFTNFTINIFSCICQV